MAKKRVSLDNFTKEYNTPEVEYFKTSESHAVPEDAPTGHEYLPPSDNKETEYKRSKGQSFFNKRPVFVMQTAAALLAVVMAKDAYGYDILSLDPFNDYEEVYVEDLVVEPDELEPEPVVFEPVRKRLDNADSSFPKLSNLEPNGNVPGYGVLNEEFIRVESSNGNVEYIYCTDGVFNKGSWWIDDDGLHLEDGSITKNFEFYPGLPYSEELVAKYSDRPGLWISDEKGFLFISQTPDAPAANPATLNLPIGEVEGASYDESTNTLTLTNFLGEYLNINLMGNAFKIKLVGDNRLTGLISWGFYYGGSITLTGSGTLTINNPNGVAILLNSESSESALMIDKDVKLNLTGSEAAIAINDSTLSKSIYYLEPLEFKSDSDDYTVKRAKASNFYTFVDEKNTAIKSIKFLPKED